ncbi:restriction endonuclease subunit S [Ruminococcus sp. RTP21484sp1_RTP31023st1_H8_RTP31023_210422]|uniref:restriction endonuclease subunit S n=1 Tax=Ruminococcus sp. RTP21484sp1_RTP31023st1_H8_RTP31023_210422 TaxID=3141611 RepID=UPI0034A29BAD
MEEKNSEKKERKMRDSGIPWIGEVPEGWKVVPLKYLLSNEANSLKVGPFGSQLSGSDFTDDGYWVYNQRSVLDKNFDSNDTFISESKFNSMNSFKVEENDILITTRGTIGKICRIPQNYHKGIIHPCIIKFRINESLLMYSLLEKIFNESDLVKKQFEINSNATTIDVIYGSTLRNILIPVPPVQIQHSIADFLDSKCSEIDALIENLRARMESVKEYKKAVITEAVTKGLDKDAKMKDSGVEWIGEVPEGWKICKVKQISNKITDGAHISPNTTNGEFKFLSVTNMNDTGALDFVNCLKINSVQYAYLVKTGCQPKKDDVLISKDGTIGKTTVVSDNNFVVASSLVIIRPNQLKIRPKYLKYCLMSNIVQEQLLSVLAGSALKRVSIEKNANLKFVYTYDMTTQQQIIDYLDSKCSEIDTLLQNYEDQIATLEEYKKSLIYEYVTGKKEVPEA